VPRGVECARHNSVPKGKASQGNSRSWAVDPAGNWVVARLGRQDGGGHQDGREKMEKVARENPRALEEIAPRILGMQRCRGVKPLRETEFPGRLGTETGTESFRVEP